MCVATGIVMGLDFGTKRVTCSRQVGEVFCSALAAEGISAFPLKSGLVLNPSSADQPLHTPCGA
jgi:cytochrome d ubiquinol oxidase subunit I